MVATLLGLILPMAQSPKAKTDLWTGLAPGTVVSAGKFSTYTDAKMQFSITVPRSWWIEPDNGMADLELGEPQLGGAAGKKMWDPQFGVEKYEPRKISEFIKPWKNDPNKSDGPRFVMAGKVGNLPYKIWTDLGWTYVDAYAETPKAVWEIEVHIPKANWRKQLPMAFDIIKSFKLLRQ